jgi:hypothetical protein
MGNEMADYLAKKGIKISQTSACKLTFHSGKLKIKRGIQVDLSEYYTIQSQHKSWGKIVENRNIVPDFPRRAAVATFQLSPAMIVWQLIYTDCHFIHPQCVSYVERKTL